MTTAAAPVRATALPLPTVASGESITVGHALHARTFPTFVIDGEVFLRTSSETLLRECGRCGGKGHMAVFGHVYAGQCFSCGRTGVAKGYKDLVSAQRAVRSAQARSIRYAAQAKIDAAIAIEKAHADAIVEDARLAVRKVELAAKEAATSFAGEIGEKITVTGTVTMIKDIEGHYGSSLLVSIDSGSGVVVKFFTTAAFAYALEVGESVTVAATVKRHEVYAGAKQTLVARPKAL